MADCDPTCPTRSTATLTLTGFLYNVKHKCYSIGDGVINIFRALQDIALAIRECSAVVQAKGYASALIDFYVTGGASLTDGQVVSVQYAKSPFDYKVTGFGVSALAMAAGGGDYSDDDIIKVKLYDFTAGKQIGDTLTLSTVQLHDKFSDSGNPIGDNISNGHIYGIKIEYNNNDGGVFVQPHLHVYIHVEPTELVNIIE